jgi:putative transposase
LICCETFFKKTSCLQKKISEEKNTAPHFLTLTVKNWYYLFDRHNRWDILLDSLCYCQKQKGLKIFHWVFMLNHIHLIVQSDNLSGFSLAGAGL